MNEAFDAGRREQLRKYKQEGPQGREAVEGSLEVYAEKFWGEVASRLFLIEQPEGLGEEEQQDVKTFIKESGKRLVVDTFHSPLFAKNDTSTAEKALSQGFFVHDLTHTIAAFDREDGKGMTPEFMKYSDGAEYTDREVLEEEVFANLFGEGRFGNLLEVARGNSVASQYAIESIDGDLKSLEHDPLLGDMRQSVMRKTYEELKELIPNGVLEAEEALDRYEDIMKSILHIQFFSADDSAKLSAEDLEAGRLKIVEAVDGLRPGGKYPQYEQVAKNILDSTDPKIRLNEMRRVLSPVFEKAHLRQEYKVSAEQKKTTDNETAKLMVEELKRDLGE